MTDSWWQLWWHLADYLSVLPDLRVMFGVVVGSSVFNDELLFYGRFMLNDLCSYVIVCTCIDWSVMIGHGWMMIDCYGIGDLLLVVIDW